MVFLEAIYYTCFWSYTLPLAGLLGCAWGLLWWRQRQGKDVATWWPTFWSWVILAGTTFLGALLGHEAFALLVVLAALVACQEFARGTGLYADWLFTGLVYLAILGVNGVALWAVKGGNGDNYGYDFFMATPIYAVAALCILPVLRNRAEGMLQNVALAVMAFVYFAFFLAHLSLLGGMFNAPEVYGYLFFLVLGTASTALTADVVDRRWGKHLLASRISTLRSWEGAVAAAAWAGLWCFTLGWTLAHFNILAILLAMVLFAVVGGLGDLIMGYILADLRLRDPTENLPLRPYLPLDYLNRLIFVAPLFFRLVHFYYPAG